MMAADKPSLIQRMFRREIENDSGRSVDRHWKMDYMGAAEFELGALPRALNDMAGAVDRLSIEERSHAKLGGKTLWVVADASGHAYADGLIERELSDDLNVKRAWRLKEPTVLEVWLGLGEFPLRRPDAAWWALNVRVPFAIFQRQEDAEVWMEDLKERVVHQADFKSLVEGA
jgi:hypothetical protein